MFDYEALECEEKGSIVQSVWESKFASGVSILGSRQFSMHPSSL
jgi:hypothetical protein